MRRYTDVENYLLTYYWVGMRIKENENELRKLVSDYGSIAPNVSRVSDDNIGNSGRISDPVLRAVIRLEEEYATQVEQLGIKREGLMAKKAEIEDVLLRSCLSDVERRYIKFRYFENRFAWQVANLIGYSETQMRYYRGKALAKVGAILKE